MPEEGEDDRNPPLYLVYSAALSCLYVSLLSFGSGKYCAAGNLASGVAGRLRCKIIWVAVDDDGFANDICNRKAVREVCHPCETVVPEQRRHIALMSRMRAGRGIIMLPGVGIRVAAVSGAGIALVDMEAEDVVRTAIIRCGKPIDFCVHQYAVLSMVETDHPHDFAVSGIAGNLRIGSRHMVKGSLEKSQPGIFVSFIYI